MDNRASPVFTRIQMSGNPVANPQSLVVSGRARFTVMTPHLIRLEWSASGQFEDRATFAFPQRYAEVPDFSHALKDQRLELETEALSLHYTDDSTPFNPTNLSINFRLNNHSVQWTPGLAKTGNLRGTRRTLDQCTGAAALQEGLLSRDGWSVFDDSGSVVWTVDHSWVEARPDEHIQDWYFFGYGHDYKALLSDYQQFGEPTPLIPRYVLGAWWSRYWAYHADDLVQVVKDFAEYTIPLDVLVVDMDWHTTEGWTGYTWNRELFPNPESFLAWVHAQNLSVTLNLHPADGVQPHEDAYAQFAERLGRDPSLGEGIKFNSTDPAFIQNYFELLHHPLENQGVDFWWLDWQQGAFTEIKNLDPLPWLNHLHFRDSTRRGRRPMLYSRWGGLGNHRYPIGFSGDAHSTWASLRFQPYFTATAANVGYGWWSHDIGGHFGAADPELYARWVQFGAVSPCLRLHATKDPLAERRPWAFPPEIYQAAKAAIQFRYRLFPYLYSAAQAATQKGLSLCYPMYYEYPEVDDAYLARGQYFLGDQMFVAPIVSPADPQTGLAAIDVWIPAGTWIEYTTHEKFTGPHWVQMLGDLMRIPIFVKAGAIVPMAPQIMRTGEFDGKYLVIVIYPDTDGQFELYEDDGTTEAYQHGEYETTLIRSVLGDSTVTISLAGTQGHCAMLPEKRTVEFHVRGISQPTQVTANRRQQTDWDYDPLSGDLVICLEDTDRHTPLEIVVTTEIHDTALAVSSNEGALAHSGRPFVHLIDYETFEDANQQLGTLILVPAADNSPFDAEIVWELQRGDSLTAFPPLRLAQCTSEQILRSPFKDEGNFVAFRWKVTVTLLWQGQTLPYSYQSQTAYPSIHQWQTLIYNNDQQPLTLHGVVGARGGLNPVLPWRSISQSVDGMFNLRQPFGAVLLEQERQRIAAREALAACLGTTLYSPSTQQVKLCLQSVGSQTCWLNGVELSPTAPIQHAKLDPMFSSWMPAESKYYALALQPGQNQLVVFTYPNAASGWWGIGATVFDDSGEVWTGSQAVENGVLQ